MSIASEITRINNNIASAYTACNGKGATMPATQNSANLATCIGSIQTGSTPTLITKNITANGTYNASSDNADGYSSVTVNVSGGGGGIGIPREVSATGLYRAPSLNSSFTFSLPSNATDVGAYSMYAAFYNSSGLTSVDCSSLTTISHDYAMYYACYNCQHLEEADFSNLTTISGASAMYYAFQKCPSLSSIKFRNLTTISGSSAMYGVCYQCTGLSLVSFPKLATVGDKALQRAFSNSALQWLYFPSLNSNSFGNKTTQFNNMLQGVTGCTVHFPSNLQSVIGSWSSVITGFSGTNTTVLFDLPATT